MSKVQVLNKSSKYNLRKKGLSRSSLNNKVIGSVRAHELKKDFPIFNDAKLVYLDNAATTQLPESVIYSMSNFYEKVNANIHRGLYKLSQEATLSYERARNSVAEFIKADEREIIFTRSTTESINLLAYSLSSLASEEKDEILLTELEHHSNLVPWQELARRKNMKLKFIKIKDDLTLDLDDAQEKISDKTAILAITHISNAVGTINPIKKIIDLTKDKDKKIITVVDAAQSAGHKSIDVKDIDCDFLAFSGHKMLGPAGIGVLYGKKELLEKLKPFNFGGNMIASVTYQRAVWNSVPGKFEAGTQNVAGAIALAEAINYLNKLGLDNIERWEYQLTTYMVAKLNELSGIKIYGPPLTFEAASGIISFTIDNIHPHDIASLMDDADIAIRGGHHCAMPLMEKMRISGTSRISFCFYNTFEDIDRLVGKLSGIIEKFN